MSPIWVACWIAAPLVAWGLFGTVRVLVSRESIAMSTNTHTVTGADLIAAERQRQIEQEGWTPEHDREHGANRLLRAAAAYETANRDLWPFDNGASWKPRGPFRNLIRAGALYLAASDAATTPNFVSGKVGAARCAQEIDRLIADVLEAVDGT